jgi:hypothetical protein
VRLAGSERLDDAGCLDDPNWKERSADNRPRWMDAR